MDCRGKDEGESRKKHVESRGKLLLREDEQQTLVRVELGVVDAANAAQLREVLRPLLPEEVSLAGVVAEQLAGRGDLEALGGRARAPAMLLRRKKGEQTCEGEGRRKRRERAVRT